MSELPTVSLLHTPRLANIVCIKLELATRSLFLMRYCFDMKQGASTMGQLLRQKVQIRLLLSLMRTRGRTRVARRSMR
jgi:hypothetical protein